MAENRTSETPKQFPYISERQHVLRTERPSQNSRTLWSYAAVATNSPSTTSERFNVVSNPVLSASPTSPNLSPPSTLHLATSVAPFQLTHPLPSPTLKSGSERGRPIQGDLKARYEWTVLSVAPNWTSWRREPEGLYSEKWGRIPQPTTTFPFDRT